MVIAHPQLLHLQPTVAFFVSSLKQGVSAREIFPILLYVLEVRLRCANYGQANHEVREGETQLECETKSLLLRHFRSETKFTDIRLCNFVLPGRFWANPKKLSSRGTQ